MPVRAISEASCRSRAPARLRRLMSILADHVSSNADIPRLSHLTKNTVQRILLLMYRTPDYKTVRQVWP